jgi:hypothetical protein
MKPRTTEELANKIASARQRRGPMAGDRMFEVILRIYGVDAVLAVGDALRKREHWRARHVQQFKLPPER